MSFYSDMATCADDLIREFGQAVTLGRSTPGAYSNGAVTVTVTNYSATGVELEYSQREIDGTRIQTGDKKLMVSAFQADGSALPLPTSADTVTYGGVTAAIIPPVKVLSPAGTVLYYELQVRGR